MSDVGTPRRLPALIFDFGNVVAHFDYALACRAFAGRLDLTPQGLLDRLRGRGLDRLVVELESGRMVGEAFSREVRALIGLGDVSHEDFTIAWRNIFRPNEPVVRLAAGLKGLGYTLVLGSNTNALHADDFQSRFAIELAPFESRVLSYQLGHMKPSRAFYEACAVAAGVPPSDCVFIDDMPENVEGARRAGMMAVLYRDEGSLRGDLRGLGVELPPAS